MRRAIIAAAIASLLLFPLAASAQDWPNRALHVYIGFAAGSGADILGRYFTHQVEILSKQTVIVDNRPGATGNIATRAAAQAKPDGYTILFSANAGMAGARYLFKELPFDTLNDLVNAFPYRPSGRTRKNSASFGRAPVHGPLYATCSSMEPALSLRL